MGEFEKVIYLKNNNSKSDLIGRFFCPFQHLTDYLFLQKKLIMISSGILETLVFIFGSGTVGSMLLFWRANKKSKNAEAAKMEAEARLASAQADKGVIDNYEALIVRYEKYIETSDKKFEDLREITDKQISVLTSKIILVENKNKEIEKQQRSNTKWLCFNAECHDRIKVLKK